MLKYYPLKQLLPCCTKLPFTASQYFGKPKKKKECAYINVYTQLSWKICSLMFTLIIHTFLKLRRHLRLSQIREWLAIGTILKCNNNNINVHL